MERRKNFSRKQHTNTRTLLVLAIIYLSKWGNSMTVEKKSDSITDLGNSSLTNHIPNEMGHLPPGNSHSETNQSVNRNVIADSGLLISQYEKCRRTKGYFDCLNFRALKSVRYLFESFSFRNVSQILSGGERKTGITLVDLEASHPGQSLFADAVPRAFGSSRSFQLLQFVMEELDRFLSRHGLMITVNEVRGDEPGQLDSPWLIDFESTKDERTGRKVKKKEYAIVFPMLVLFKFLKIKMLLVPILLGVVFLKKLLIITLTLLPYLVGLFGCCRRPPFLGPIQSAGILQELDTRGEFSSNLGYSFPYKEGFSFRQRDRAKPTEIYTDY